MKKDLTIIATFILCFISLWTYSQEPESKKSLVLFTDRDYCISGDTLWFKVYVPFSEDDYGNVVHVQLDSENGSIITGVAKQYKTGFAEGFLEIPDSLSTGFYYLSSFLNAQRINNDIRTIGRNLFVYNRFDENVTQLSAPASEEYLKVRGEKIGDISVGKLAFKCREEVKGKIILSDNVEFATIKACMYDPFANNNSGFLNINLQNTSNSIPKIAEKDGVLLSGKFHEVDGTPGSKELVLFSIPGQQPHFDYYYTGEDGCFHFFLKNAVGNANVILQTANSEDREYKYSRQKNYLKRKDITVLNSKFLDPLQQDFIKVSQNTYFLSRLFKENSLEEDTFLVLHSGNVPFFGKADSHIAPADFYDLPDFREISRELLPDVQYRKKEDNCTFRVLNKSEDKFFENEAFVLLNGIPVFKNQHIAALSSNDIRYIDVVQEQRIYGDLIFNGVISINLTDKSNSWLIKQKNIFSQKMLCLQAHKEVGYNSEKIFARHIPDMRQNFMYKRLKETEVSQFSFRLSDMKGKVQITVEGLTKSGELFKTTQIVEVN